MNAEVVCVSSHEPTQPYYHFREFKESLRRFGEYPTILGTDTPWQGLMTKPRLFRDWIRGGNAKSDRLIIVDSWDVVFSLHPHGIGDRLEEFECDCLFNSEKSCFPRGDLAHLFANHGTPWQHLNSGVIIGFTEAILTLLDSIGIDEIGVDRRNADDTDWVYPNDQEYFTLAFLNSPVRCKLDTKCELAQTLSGCELSEFDFDSQPFRNLVTGTTPGIWHGNGDGKNKIMPTIFERLSL